MIELVLAPEAAPFTVALAIMLLIAAFEGIGLLFGLGLSSTVDTLLPDLDLAEPDIPDFDAGLDMDGGMDAPNLDASGGSASGLFTRFLGWICLGKVPALVLLVAFLTSFGVAGMALQSATSEILGGYMPALLAVVPAFAVAVPSTRYLALGLAHLMPQEETEAVSRATFVGRTAVVTRGVAKRGLPAEAKLRDQHGQVHYVLVQPDHDEDAFDAGEEVLIVRQSGGEFRVIANMNPVLSRS